MAPNRDTPKLSLEPTEATPVPTAENDDLLTVKDVAGILKLPPKQVYGLHIPCVQLTARRIRFKRSVFIAWLAARPGWKTQP